MSSFKLRPRFEKICDGQMSDLEEHFKDLLKDHPEFTGTVSKSFARIRMCDDELHYWSPQLTLMLEEHEKGTKIRGLYGPNPSVWAMFAFGYGSIATLIIGFLIWGGVKWQFEDDPFLITTGIPILLGAAVILYLVAQFGQKLGAEQMFELHHFFEDSIKQRVHIE